MSNATDVFEAVRSLERLERRIDNAIELLQGADLDNPFERDSDDLDRIIGDVIDTLKALRDQNESLRPAVEEIRSLAEAALVKGR